MSRVEVRLQELGFVLPPAKTPVANYLGTKRSGDLLFVSGRVSELRGEVGSEVSVSDAAQAARDTVLQLLAIVKADIGDLDRVVSIERMQGFVRSAPTFTEQPRVIDGASDLLVALFGEPGRHARTATGAAQLPFGAAVQLDLVVRLDDPRNSCLRPHSLEPMPSATSSARVASQKGSLTHELDFVCLVPSVTTILDAELLSAERGLVDRQFGTPIERQSPRAAGTEPRRRQAHVGL